MYFFLEEERTIFSVRGASFLCVNKSTKHNVLLEFLLIEKKFHGKKWR